MSFRISHFDSRAYRYIVANERSGYIVALLYLREINSAEVELDVARSIQRLKRIFLCFFVILSRLSCVVVQL